MLYAIKSQINKIVNNTLLKKWKVICSPKLNIAGRLVLENYGKIIIGDNAKIISDFAFNVVGGYQKTKIYCRSGAIIRIGNNVGISNSIITAYESITMEDNVAIGAGCLITDSDHHSLVYNLRINGDIGKSAPIILKEGAFIGAGCIILKGVTIGKHSVLGAGSVITKSIPDGELWAGNPAKFVKKVE